MKTKTLLYINPKWSTIRVPKLFTVELYLQQTRSNSKKEIKNKN
jgi:hypothetical protein